MHWSEDADQLKEFTAFPFQENAHSERSLSEHLLGVYEILGEWRVPRSVRLAGLFHSVYGTSSYSPENTGNLTKRVLAKSIGTEAEELVMAYCSIDRSKLLTLAAISTVPLTSIPNKFPDGPSVEVSPSQFGELLDILYADRLEQMAHRDVVPIEDWARLHLTGEAMTLWGLARGFLSPGAKRHLAHSANVLSPTR